MRRHLLPRFVMVVGRRGTCGEIVRMVGVGLGCLEVSQGQVAERKVLAKEVALVERAKEKDLEEKEGLEVSLGKVVKEGSEEEKEGRKVVASIVEDHTTQINARIGVLEV